VAFEGRTISYGELDQRIGATAAGLAAHGVVQGDRIAYCGLNRVELLELLFAATRLGAILMPVNNRLSVGEIAYQLGDARPAAVFGTDGFTATLDAAADAAGLAVGMVRRDLDSDPFSDVPVDAQASLPPDGDRPALMVYTSGTTGSPKGAVLTERSLLHTVLNGVTHQDLHRDDVILTALPLFHVGGLNIQTLPALYAGATVVLQRRFDPENYLELVSTHRPSQSLLVPAALRAVIGHERFDRTDMTSLHGMNTGSSVVPRAVIEPWLERGVKVGQVYGSTETGPTAVVLDYADGASHIGSCGKAALHTELRIVDDNGNDVHGDEAGELWLRGPNLFSEYWRDPQSTAQAMAAGGWYRSGDVGYRDEQAYVFISDRKHDVVISGGENIYPAEVENILADHPAIAEVAVIGIPDDRWGETVEAVVVRNDAHPDPLDLRELRAWCDGRLARYKQPHALRLIEELPRTALGKVKKHLLRAKH